MFLNIQKLQDGGSTPSSPYGFLDYIPFIQQPTVPTIPNITNNTSETKSNKTETKKEDNKILTDKMIEGLMSKGLTSDVNIFLSEVSAMYADPMINNPFGITINPNALLQKQLMLIGRLNQIQNNKTLYDEAIKHMNTVDSSSEIAITGSGKMLAQNIETGKLEEITPEEYYKNREESKYALLTNFDLSDLRNKSLAFDVNSIGILNNSVGSLEVNKFIKETINEATSDSTKHPLVPGVTTNVITQQGFDILKQAEVTGEIDLKSNQKQLKAATSYLFKMMPNKYRNFLKAKAASEGLDPNKDLYQLIVSDYVQSKQSIEETINLDGVNGSEGGSKTSPVTIWEQMTKGASKARGVFKIQSQEDLGDLFDTNVAKFRGITDKDGKNLPSIMSLEGLLQDTQLNTIADRYHMSAGNQIITLGDLTKIAINTSEFNVTMMPVKEDGSIDLDTHREIQAILKKAEDENWSEIQIRTALQEKELLKFYDYLFKPSFKNTENAFLSGMIKPFILLNGYISNGADVVKDKNKYYSEIASDEGDLIMKQLETDLDKRGISKSSSGHNVGITNWWNNVKQLPIFIPMSDSAQEDVLIANESLLIPASKRMYDKVFNKQNTKLTGPTNFPNEN